MPVSSFVVVRFAIENRHGPVELFYENQPHHLVRECHPRQRNLLVRTFVHLFRESVRSAYYENQFSAGRIHLSAHPFGKLHRHHFLSALIEQNHRVARLNLFQNAVALKLLLLFLSQLLRVFYVRYDDRLTYVSIASLKIFESVFPTKISWVFIPFFSSDEFYLVMFFTPFTVRSFLIRFSS